MGVHMKDIQFPVSYATLYRSTIHSTKLSKRIPIFRKLRYIFLCETFYASVLYDIKMFNLYISIKTYFYKYIYKYLALIYLKYIKIYLSSRA